jgi:hypothetical protein
MQFRVVIPDHVKAGQTIRIHCPDGTEANVKVPNGLKTGDSFIFEMSVDQLKNPQALLDSLKEKSAKAAKDAAAAKKKPGASSTTTTSNTSNTKTTTAAAGSSSSSSFTKSSRGFLDREIVNIQDFLLALSVGLVIGLGIVLGFILGILYVTREGNSFDNALLLSSFNMKNHPNQQHILVGDGRGGYQQQQQQKDSATTQVYVDVPQTATRQQPMTSTGGGVPVPPPSPPSGGTTQQSVKARIMEQQHQQWAQGRN